MRIGLIFFGLPRCSSITFPKISEFIFEALKRHELVVNACFSDQNAITNSRSLESGNLSSDNYDYFAKFDHEFVPPQNLFDVKLHAEVLQFGDVWKDGGTSLKNLMLQLASLQKAYLACKVYECDIYIFIRPDLFIHEVIPFEPFFKRYKNKNAVMLPSWQWHGGVNDRFCVATAQAADAYGMRYDHILDYCQQTNRGMHSEKFLYHQFKSHNTKIKTCLTKLTRVRMNGNFAKEVFSVGKRMGSSRRILSAQLNQVRYLDILLGCLKVWAFYTARNVRNLKKLFN